MSTAAESIDQGKAEEFGGRMLGVVNDGFTALGLSIGHKTGLFDKLAELPPSTSGEIAAAAGLNERYVREWLGAMTVAEVTEYDANTGRYRLPAEHAAALTRAAGADNLAHLAEFIGFMGRAELDVAECFTKGGGVPYERYGGFAEAMREDSAVLFDLSLVPAVVPLVPGLREQLEAGIDVADVGCGAGHAVNVLAREFPRSRFTGYDFSEEAIGLGRAEAAEWGLANASFEVSDVAKLNVEGRFDVITAFDAIHDQAFPRKVLANIHTALKPGGTFLMADIAGSSNLEENLEHPLGQMLYTVSYMHCMSVSLAYGGEGLGTMWGEQTALELLREAGFTDVEVKQAEGDAFNSYYVARKE